MTSHSYDWSRHTMDLSIRLTGDQVPASSLRVSSEWYSRALDRAGAPQASSCYQPKPKFITAPRVSRPSSQTLKIINHLITINPCFLHLTDYLGMDYFFRICITFIFTKGKTQSWQHDISVEIISTRETDYSESHALDAVQDRQCDGFMPMIVVV